MNKVNNVKNKKTKEARSPLRYIKTQTKEKTIKKTKSSNLKYFCFKKYNAIKIGSSLDK